MASLMDYPARGKVIGIKDSGVIFAPFNSNYELHLAIGGQYNGPLNQPVLGIVRVTARKVYTVPSGGNFISPIFGPPRIVQGHVLYLDEKNMVVRAGCPVVVDLPTAELAIDLDNGQITVGKMVNVAVLPGARFSLAETASPVAQTVG